MGACKN